MRVVHCLCVDGFFEMHCVANNAYLTHFISYKAFVVLHANEEATAEEIIEWCRTRLAKFRVTEFVEFCKELPRTSVGKIQKHLLRNRDAK